MGAHTLAASRSSRSSTAVPLGERLQQSSGYLGGCAPSATSRRPSVTPGYLRPHGHHLLPHRASLLEKPPLKCQPIASQTTPSLHTPATLSISGYARSVRKHTTTQRATLHALPGVTTHSAADAFPGASPSPSAADAFPGRRPNAPHRHSQLGS